MCIVTICCPVCHVINSEINLSFLIKPFFHETKKSRCRYLKNIKSFKHEIKIIFFITLKGFSGVRNCLIPKSGPLSKNEEASGDAAQTITETSHKNTNLKQLH